MKKQIHYNIDNIDKLNADFNLIFGEKSNGKSYQVKHKKAVEHYLETGKRFILLRRWREDVTNLWVERYFSDVDVAKLTENRYNCITNYRKELYFSIYDVETGKTKRYEKIGYVASLSTEQHFSGASFLDVDIIIFEEFMERGSYIPNEPDKLMFFYSTVDRKRGTTKLYMVGNSISRVCPYIKVWGLDSIFKKMKQGDIEKKVIHNEANDVTLAIEYCMSSGGKTMAIGNASKSIDSGAWQTLPQPKLKKSKNEYKVCYRIGFFYKGFKYLGDLLYDKEDGSKCWFVYPYYKDFEKNIFIFSDVVNQSYYWNRNIYDNHIKNEKVRNILSTFSESNLFFSDDLCGTEFKEVIDFSIKR